MRLWSVPHFEGVELFSASIQTHAFPKHMHEHYTIGLSDRGRGSFFHRGEKKYSHRTVVNIVNPAEAHTGESASDEGWTYRDINLSPVLIGSLLDKMEWSSMRPPHFGSAVINDGLIRRRMDELFDALCGPADRLTCDSLLLQAVAALVARYGDEKRRIRAPGKEPASIRVARDYIEANYAKPISIDDLAALVNLSPYYLIRAFRDEVGLPPHAFQVQLRVREAKRDLRTRKPIARIAADHGFYDQSHLNRHFRRVLGVTPKRYRDDSFVQEAQPPID